MNMRILTAGSIALTALLLAAFSTTSRTQTAWLLRWIPTYTQEASSAASSSSARAVQAVASSSIKSATSSRGESWPMVSDDLTIPVLVYHHIRDASPWPKETWSYKMSVSPDVFETQMRWLQEHGYTPITLDHMIDTILYRRRAPPKPVVITFDDNQRTSYEIGVPIMQRYGMTATYYLVANRLDNEAFINRADIAALLDAGMDIQSHSMSHPILTNLTNEDVDWQLAESKRILEELTGKPVSHIAYPLTAHNQRIRERTAAMGYRTGTIMDPRRATLDSDPYKVPRIMMTDDTDLARVLP